MILHEAGDKAGVAAATAAARAAGFCAAKKDEDVSMVDAILMLGRVLSNKRDAYTMAGVMALLGTSFYLDLCGKVLTGHVLTLAGGGADAAILTKNWAARWMPWGKTTGRDRGLPSKQITVRYGHVLPSFLLCEARSST